MNGNCTICNFTVSLKLAQNEVFKTIENTDLPLRVMGKEFDVIQIFKSIYCSLAVQSLTMLAFLRYVTFLF